MKKHPILNYREKKGVTQAEAARQLGWNPAILCRIENFTSSITPERAIALEEWSGGELKKESLVFLTLLSKVS